MNESAEPAAIDAGLVDCFVRRDGTDGAGASSARIKPPLADSRHQFQSTDLEAQPIVNGRKLLLDRFGSDGFFWNRAGNGFKADVLVSHLQTLGTTV